MHLQSAVYEKKQNDWNSLTKSIPHHETRNISKEKACLLTLLNVHYSRGQYAWHFLKKGSI